MNQENNQKIQKQGGTMNNQEELQKAFLQFLIQDAAQQGIQLQSEQDLQSYAEQLGQEGIQAKYQEFIQKMQGAGIKAALGAKLSYYQKLKGTCPEGEKLTYLKVGGRMCRVCQKTMKCGGKTKKAEDGKKLNVIQKFKQGREQIKSEKCGSKMKKKK